MISPNSQKLSYGEAIRSGFHYLLTNYPEVFVIGQGLWSPWYVGNSMTNLDTEFGINRIIDTPVSESACTGAAVGASIVGMRPIVVHPRMDFMLYAMDAIVNQAAKWSSMFGGQSHPSVTIRSIINRGGEQGAQHSQALHAWFAHIPGLRVVMPSTVADARDLLIASVLCDDPVIFIDDRWLYDQVDILPPVVESSLASIKPQILSRGSDITIVSSGYSTKVSLAALELLKSQYGFSADLIDLRVLTPFDHSLIVDSVNRTRRLLVVDGATRTAGFAAEVISATVENIQTSTLLKAPSRVTLPDAPAPTASNLENNYYFNESNIVTAILNQIL